METTTISLGPARSIQSIHLSSSSSPSSSSSSSSKQSIGQSWFSSFVIIIGVVLLLLGCGCGPSLQIAFAPKLITRFCYNSPNLSTINSQCVLCNYYMFDATVLGCTGSTALTMNITATQAFCVISQCLGQIRQQPVFLGRRKRDSNSNMIMEQLAPIQRYKDSNLDMINQSAISTLPVEYRIEKEVEADIVPDDDIDNDDDDDDDGYEISGKDLDSSI
ncbi:uncharacterized protein LOC124493445 [Dermatophagoides farinae]|uniref:uncharacterized protein LOC124493445 n=1 Tax=Dermatophagoides farinae TaxID=6954 RepID=UPI003F63E71C